MKQVAAIITFILLTIIVIPIILVLVTSPIANLPKEDAQDDIITVQRIATSEKIKMNFEDYISCVLFAKHSPTLPIEVLKSLAVIERTNAILNCASHGTTAVCDNPDHCNPVMSEAEAKKQWDVSYSDAYIQTIKTAVQMTRGVYLSYDDKAITAFYHNVSAAGVTENATDFLGRSLPYLKSVDAKDSDASLKSLRYKTINKSSFEELLLSVAPELNTNLKPYIGFPKTTPAGNVLEMTICDRKFSGVLLAKLFGTNATAFTIAFDNDNIIFKISGIGNSLGLSIEGAKVLAVSGLCYQDILAYYYNGTTLKTK